MQRSITHSTSRLLSVVGRHVVFALALGTAFFGIVPPAAATISAPGSASVLPGGATSVTVTTDAATIGVSGGASGISVAPSSGTGPTVSFTFTVGTSVAPGSYGYTFFDDAGGTGSFTLIVNSPPTTTTSSTTTTTQAPTTTTRPTTTTTRPTTTTTRPTTTTTSSTTTSSTTTTIAPTTTRPTTTTTSSTTTTTTLPPPTTTSTLLPAGIVAIDDADGGGGGFSNPFVWFGGGAALFALALAGVYTLWRRRQPTYGAATPGFVLAWRQRRERRRVSKPGQQSRSAGFSYWWYTSGPIVSYHEWRASRHAGKTVRRQIEERQRLRRDED